MRLRGPRWCAVLTCLIVLGVPACSAPPWAEPVDTRLPAAAPVSWTGPSGADRLVPQLFFQARQPEGTTATPVPLFEVLPDDDVRLLPTGEVEGLVVDGVQPTSDGVVLYGTAGEDPDGGLRRELVVLDDAGAVRSREEVSLAGRGTGLLGAPDASTTILQRVGKDDDGLPAGPVEVTVRTATDEAVLATRQDPVAAGAVAGNRLVLAGGGQSFDGERMIPCWVEALRTDVVRESSRGTRTVTDALPGCEMVHGLRISPDSRWAAVAFQTQAPPQMQVSIVRLADLAVVGTREVGIPVGACDSCQFPAFAGYLGMAWADDRTLRVARMTDLPLTMRQDQIAEELRRHLDVLAITVPAG
ncbi:hypothetical protein ACIG47_03670 [Promicromonospora sp. NPDC052451]|uniref:hypothetical protein n=1 Tax=Promicromonospora sp. NPDC052451 TaxID=3364407 RepID=UPI0037CA3BD6